MRLLQFVNTGLGIADTTRSLVSGSSGGVAHSVSGLSEKIDGVNAHLTSEIRSGVAAVREDIGTLSNMASTMLAQQAVLHQEIQQVIHGVSSLNTLIKKHAHVIDEQLRFVIDGPLQQACQTLMAYLVIPTNLATPTDANTLVRKKAVTLRPDKVQDLLNILEEFIAHNFAGMQKCTTIPSEDAVPFLSQPSNADNIAFIAGRLHLLFGARIPEKFLLLPPVSLKFYYLVATLLLKGLEKHPDLMTEDKAQTICKKIVDTLKTYLEFATFLKKNPRIFERLLNLYKVHRDKVGRVLARQDIAALKAEPALYAMEEIRLLLTTLLSGCFETTHHEISELESMPHILEVAAWPFSKRKEYVEKKCSGDPVANYRLKLQYGVIPLTHDAWSPLVSQNQHQAAADCFYHNLSQDVSAQEKFKLSSKPEIDIVGSAPAPKPSTFVVGWNDWNNNWHSLETRSLDDNFLSRHPELVPDQRYVVTAPLLLLYVSAHCGLYASDIPARTDWGYFYSFYSSLNSEWHISGSKSNNYNNRYVKSINGESFTAPSVVKYGLSRVPTEVCAIATHISRKDQAIYELLLKFHIVFTNGRHEDALALLKQHTFDEPYKASYLLFLVSILGHWEVWQAFSKQYPTICNNYNWTMKDGSWTPLMLAALYGRLDVVFGLTQNSTLNIMVRCVAESGKPARTAAEIALDEGYLFIAEHLIKKQPNRENDLSEAAKKRYAELKSNYGLRKNETGARNWGLVTSVTQAAASDYEKGLEKMCGDIEASKKKLGAYVPASAQPVTQSAAVATSAQVVVEELSDTETDVGQEGDLNNTYREFSEEKNMHFSEEKTFCAKPQTRPFNRPGYRFFDKNDRTLFPDDDHFRAFHRRLKRRDYTVVTEERLADNLLVKLPLHNRAPRH